MRKTEISWASRRIIRVEAEAEGLRIENKEYRVVLSGDSRFATGVYKSQLMRARVGRVLRTTWHEMYPNSALGYFALQCNHIVFLVSGLAADSDELGWWKAVLADLMSSIVIPL